MNKIAKKIQDSQNIVITAHISEDADAIGSTFALTTALRNIGKIAPCSVEDYKASGGYEALKKAK